MNFKFLKVLESSRFAIIINLQLQSLSLSNSLFGFSTKLRSATQGRAGLVMSFSRFDRA